MFSENLKDCLRGSKSENTNDVSKSTLYTFIKFIFVIEKKVPMRLWQVYETAI